VFDFGQPLLIAGLLLGLASSLHCLGMCSGIATSLCLAAPCRPDQRARSLVATNLLINTGRIAAYCLAGAVVGGIGSNVFGAFDRSAVNIVLRWAAAVSLGWIGMSMIGLMPVPPSIYRLGAIVSEGLSTAVAAVRLPPALGLFFAGCVWGFFPCAMVYAALFYAMLSGTWLSGAVVMLGFGAGTLPPVMAAGLGVPLLYQKAQTVWLRAAVGVAIMLLGFATVAIPAATLAEFCHFG